MSDKLNQAASITPPVPGKNTIILPTSTSAVRIKLPSDWKGWMTVQADGAKVYFAVGSATVAVDETHTSTVVSEEVTAHSTGECAVVPNGSEVRVNLDEVRRGPDGELYLSHKDSAVDGHVRLIRTSGGVTL